MATQMTVWQALEAITQQMPLSKSKVESLFATQFVESDNTGNEAFHFYKSGRVALSSDVAIATIDLRIKRAGGHPGFLALQLEGACISLDEVREKYSKLEITDVPRGRSLDDVTSHTAALTWGELSFSFKERRPQCLSSITFDPKKRG